METNSFVVAVFVAGVVAVVEAVGCALGGWLKAVWSTQPSNGIAGRRVRHMAPPWPHSKLDQTESSKDQRSSSSKPSDLPHKKNSALAIVSTLASPVKEKTRGLWIKYMTYMKYMKDRSPDVE